MADEIESVRRRLVEAMREDPPFKLAPGGCGGPILDRWVARRLSRQELDELHRLEELHGEGVLAELFADVLLEAGAVRPPGTN